MCKKHEIKQMHGVYSMQRLGTFRRPSATSRVICELNPFGILVSGSIRTRWTMVRYVFENNKMSNKYQYYGIGPIILGKFDRSCLIWVYGFQLYLFTGKSIDFERNRMAPEIWLALRVEFGLISCFVVRTFLDYLIGYNLKISFSYCR